VRNRVYTKGKDNSQRINRNDNDNNNNNNNNNNNRLSDSIGRRGEEPLFLLPPLLRSNYELSE
jgi:hypothetical protein